MRFCFSNGGCTQLSSLGAAYLEARQMAPTLQQNATVHYLFFQTPNFYAAPRAPMVATRNAISFQLGIPSNQWEIEVQAWMQFLLATTQTTITHIAAGPGIARSDFDVLAGPLEWPGLCGSQRMGAPNGYSNISVLGLALVVAVSGVIILANLTLIQTLKHSRLRNHPSLQVMDSWTRIGILQVQRKAYEGIGFTNWTKLNSSVPITMDNRPLPPLDAETSIAQADGTVARHRDGVQSESSPLPPSASRPTPTPPFSSNPRLSVAKITGLPEAENELEESVSGVPISENPSYLGVQSGGTSISTRSSSSASGHSGSLSIRDSPQV
jgi:hypothetical protein